jgi:hypothetical protein
MIGDEATGLPLHNAYAAAINSNDIDRLMALLADDVVFQVSGEPELVGHEAVREWGQASLKRLKPGMKSGRPHSGIRAIWPLVAIPILRGLWVVRRAK